MALSVDRDKINQVGTAASACRDGFCQGPRARNTPTLETQLKRGRRPRPSRSWPPPAIQRPRRADDLLGDSKIAELRQQAMGEAASGCRWCRRSTSSPTSSPIRRRRPCFRMDPGRGAEDQPACCCRGAWPTRASTPTRRSPTSKPAVGCPRDPQVQDPVGHGQQVLADNGSTWVWLRAHLPRLPHPNKGGGKFAVNIPNAGPRVQGHRHPQEVGNPCDGFP